MGPRCMARNFKSYILYLRMYLENKKCVPWCTVEIRKKLLFALGIKICNKKLFCKGGAEGVFLFAHLKKEVAGAIKVIDGNERAIPSAIAAILKKLKIIKWLGSQSFVAFGLLLNII